MAILIGAVLCAFVDRRLPQSPKGDIAAKTDREPPAQAATDSSPNDDLQLAAETTSNPALNQAAEESFPAEPPRASSETQKSDLPKIAIDEPWITNLSLSNLPWSASDPRLTADDSTSGHRELTDAETKRWFAPVDGCPFICSTDLIGKPVRRTARFQGLARLRAPWLSDSVLRVTPFNIADFTFYFWRGQEGVAFKFYTGHEPNLWAAFEISRSDITAKPDHWGLLTTDNGSYVRSNPGSLDIRFQEGALVLARGGLILMSVPFPHLPTETFVEGQFQLRGLSVFRSEPFFNRPDPTRAAIISSHAATLPWSRRAESPGTIATNDEGSMSFTIDSRDTPGLLYLPLSESLAKTKPSTSSMSFIEVIVNIESADPGTGIFLGDRSGHPLQRVGFQRDTTTQQTTYGLISESVTLLETNFNWDETPPPYLSSSFWIKLTTGLNSIDVQTSADGKNWGHFTASYLQSVPGVIESFGLYGLSGPTARTIRLKQVTISELTSLTNLRNLSLPGKQERTNATPPHENNVLAQSSAQDPENSPTKPHIKVDDFCRLIERAIQSNLTFEQKRQLLDDACLVFDGVDESFAKRIEDCYEELGWQLLNSDDPHPMSRIRAAWLWSPLWTRHPSHSGCDRLHSDEIIRAIYRSDWPAAWASAQSAPFWSVAANPDAHISETSEILNRHARWAKATVADRAPQLDDGTAGVLPINQRHPVVTVLNKDAYHAWSELQSALSGGNYDEACRIAISIGQAEMHGLLPENGDRDVFISLSAALARSRVEHPQFVDTMSERFESQGMVRVRSAINRRDIPALRATVWQFMGTEASREALTWLGDTALSLGQFDAASEHYHEALINADTNRQDLVAPRLHLSQVLGGQNPETQSADTLKRPSPKVIEFHGTTISANEYQFLITSSANRDAKGDRLHEAPRQPSALFPPGGFSIELRSEFGLQTRRDAGRGEFRSTDIYGRQLSVNADERRIYVSNRIQISAFSTETGQEIWTQGLGDDQGDAHALPFTPMKPLLAGNRLFARRLMRNGVELACFNADDGKLIWRQRPFLGVLSDPLIWNGKLFSLLLTKVEEDQLQVEAASFDAATGVISEKRPMFRLRETQEQQFSGQILVNEQVAVCTVGGTTACFDRHGDIRWLRRHTLLRTPIDELAEDFRQSPLIVNNDRVIVAMPGVREIRCLDLGAGHTVWNQPISNLRGILCANPTRIIADTTTGLVALDAESGKIIWRYPIKSRLEAYHIDGQTLVISVRSNDVATDSLPSFVWLDLNSGIELGHSTIDITPGHEFQFGPMLSAGSKWWVFVGKSNNEPKRSLSGIRSTIEHRE